MANDELMHYGTPRHSGRYPWGSGKNPQRHKNFRTRVAELRAQGVSEVDIAKSMGFKSTQDLRSAVTLHKAADEMETLGEILKLKDKGLSNRAIGEKLSMNESVVRTYLNADRQERIKSSMAIVDTLKAQVDKHPYLDVGDAVDIQLGVSRTKMNAALAYLKTDGYKVTNLYVEQATNSGKYTTIQVLTKDNETYQSIREHQKEIISPQGVYFENSGLTARNIEPPASIDSSRIKIRYNEEGGSRKDGVIEIRPGVADLSLGGASYAQVRIAVDGTHYLKGMAMYSNSLPPGIDIQFNTNKHVGTPMISADKENSVLKPMKSDPNNPFGSTIKRQLHYTDSKGKEKLSAINIVNEDEDWGKWKKTLSAQFLSKQAPVLIKQQLNATYADRKAEFDDICALTNPTVKKVLLQDFADNCDSAAVNLQAKSLPRQAAHVILPLESLKDNEVYAPNYDEGEEVILVRYPHEGTFEIPKLIVNNKNSEGKALLGQAVHAIGINSNVAAQLSGADFDGDTVTVIPTRGQTLTAAKAVKELVDFSTTDSYRAYPGMPETGPATGFHKQQEMGKVSNLITDMNVQGAPQEELIRATKCAMVVIDAEKHNLDWRRAYDELGIAQLKEKYQGGANRGAATIISKARSEARVDQRKPRYGIDPKTGAKIFYETGNTYKKTTTPNGDRVYYKDEKAYIKVNGEFVPYSGKVKTEIKKYQDTSTKMYEAKDAYDLVLKDENGNPKYQVEVMYADYANSMKALGNEARKEYVSTPSQKRDPTAAVVYADAVSSLKQKLNEALKHSPKERQAQAIARSNIEAIKQANPGLADDKKELKKVSAQCLAAAREQSGASQGGKSTKNRVEITDYEWQAIQAGAITDTTLRSILRYADSDRVRQLATPREAKPTLSDTSIARAKRLLNAKTSNGLPKYTQAEVANALGVSVSTLTNVLELGKEEYA